MKAKTFRIIAFTVAGVLLALLIALTCVVNAFNASLRFFFGKSNMGTATRAAGEALATQIAEEGVVLVENNGVLPFDKDTVKKAAVLGWSATQYVQGGSGSGRSTDNSNNGNLLPQTTFLEALDAAGIEYDTAITDYYSKFCASRPFYDVGSGGGALNVHDYEYCRLIEPSVSAIPEYSTLLNETAKNYNTAIVVISRISGESIDCPMVQYKNYTGTGSTPTSGALTGAAVDKTRTYLDISTEEEELLDFAAKNFDKVVVLINNTNAMNLGFIDKVNKSVSDGIDACVIAGGSGNNSIGGLINVLYGEKVLETQVKEENGRSTANVAKYEGEQVLVSPSGKTVDTYVYDFSTNPTFVYSAMDGVSQYTGISVTDKIYPFDGTTENGNVNYTNKGEKYTGVSYIDYIEGIYVGYKWYETADAENFWSSSTAKDVWGVSGYDEVVQYPFGFGLSYTEFEWTVVNWTVDDGKITVVVDVVNVGDYAGQEVVELYYTPPYTGGLEKSAVNLCAFAKTQTLLPQKDNPDDPSKYSQRLTLSFDIQDMASYDQNSGDGAYVLEEGDYTISLRTDAHNVAEVASSGHSATYIYHTKDEVYNSYAKGAANGDSEIRNLFLDESSDGIAIDGSDSNQNIDWLTRKNSFGNFPFEKAAARAWQSVLKDTNLFTTATASQWDAQWLEYNGVQSYGGIGSYKLANVKKVNTQDDSGLMLDYENDRNEAFTDDAYFFGNPDNFDDEDAWNQLLNQTTKTEMTNLVLHGYVHEEGVESIGKPKTRSLDGPSQIASFNAPAYAQIGYPNPTVLGQSWNAELATSFGLTAAQQALGAGVDGWYAPGANLHRSAFGGRNYEYYSEDSFLSGVFCANTVRGALDMGVYTYIKHVIGYDQESMRDGLYCWMTEQTLRETLLRPFKMAVDKGATGLMSSYGRIGAVWSGGSRALLTDLLRNEWGYKGTVLTDYSDHTDFMNGDQMIRAGGDLWMDGYADSAIKGSGGPGSFKMDTNSEAFTYNLRQACKHIIYTWANAAYEAANSEISDTIPIESASIVVFAWWWLVVGIVDVLLAVGAGLLIFFGIKRKDKPAVAEAAVASYSPTDGGPSPSDEVKSEETITPEPEKTEEAPAEVTPEAVPAEEQPAEQTSTEEVTKAEAPAKKTSTGTKSGSTAKKTSTGTKSGSTAKKTSTGTKSGSSKSSK